ncbi:thiol reductant ABC exporter subunit CydD [Neobacillus sp. K501]
MDKALFSYKGAMQVLIRLAVLTAMQGVMIILQAYFLAEAISSLFGGDLFRTVIKELLLFFFALVFRQLLVGFKRNLAFQYAVITTKELRQKLLNKLFTLGHRFVREEGSGQTVTLVMEGTNKFRQYLELYLPKIMNAALIPAMVCFYIFFENIRSAVILLVTFPIVIIFMILLGKAAKSKADRQYRSYQLLSNHFVDSLRGLETLKYLGLSKSHSEKITIVSESYRKATIETLRIAFLSSFALDFFTMLSIATVAVFLGLGLINGTMELSSALVILILAPEFFLPVREAGKDYHATLDGKNVGKKIQKILNIDHVIEDNKTILSYEPIGCMSVKGMGVKFAETDNYSLQDINFTCTGSKKIGIIGASGSGKSTFIDVMSGFLTPSNGEFLINDIKVNTLAYRSWQEQINYIPQHPYLFNDTILNNIRFYYREASEQEVEEAARKAGLTGIIEALPEGLQTIIGEGGRILSGGQEQRIALARAFLGQRKIILLDEPTAHLDIETEAELKGTMLQLFENKLVFFATHRLHWMLDMDQIIVLDRGKLVETGTHKELIAQRGSYYQLVHAQLEAI